MTVTMTGRIGDFPSWLISAGTVFPDPRANGDCSGCGAASDDHECVWAGRHWRTVVRRDTPPLCRWQERQRPIERAKQKVDPMARRKQAETEQEGQDFTQAMLDLGMKIREARKRAGLNQIELAEAAGLAASYVHEMEAVGANLTFKALLKIAACLEVSLRDLMPDNGFEAELSPNIAELSAILRLTASGLEAHLASDLRRALEQVVAKKS